MTATDCRRIAQCCKATSTSLDHLLMGRTVRFVFHTRTAGPAKERNYFRSDPKLDTSLNGRRPTGSPTPRQEDSTPSALASSFAVCQGAARSSLRTSLAFQTLQRGLVSYKKPGVFFLYLNLKFMRLSFCFGNLLLNLGLRVWQCG